MQTVCNTYWDAGKGNLTAQNTRKPFGGRGSAPDPAVGAYSAPTNPLVGGGGAGCRLSRNPSPALGPSGLDSFTPTPKLFISDAVAANFKAFDSEQATGVYHIYRQTRNSSCPLTAYPNRSIGVAISFLKLLQNWRKRAVLYLALYCGAIWRRRENRNMGAQLQFLICTRSKDICENLLPVWLLVSTNLFLPSHYWTIPVNIAAMQHYTATYR